MLRYARHDCSRLGSMKHDQHVTSRFCSCASLLVLSVHFFGGRNAPLSSAFHAVTGALFVLVASAYIMKIFVHIDRSVCWLFFHVRLEAFFEECKLRRFDATNSAFNRCVWRTTVSLQTVFCREQRVLGIYIYSEQQQYIPIYTQRGRLFRLLSHGVKGNGMPNRVLACSSFVYQPVLTTERGFRQATVSFLSEKNT